MLSVISLSLALFLGIIVTKKISSIIPKFSEIFFIISLGIILFTAINYFFSLIFSFPTGIIVAQVTILVFILSYILLFKPDLNFSPLLSSLMKEKLLVILMIVIGIVLFMLFNHHILRPINGDLHTGESTYGDLSFHLSTITHIAYTNKFPPNNPMFANTSLVYPYFINFFSAILVYEGWSLRQAIMLPGLILSLSLIGLIYDLCFTLFKNSFKSFLVVILYLFNGGLGFYFFLKDYSFNLFQIIQPLLHPTNIKEYSHLFEQNIQWGNFLSRMIVPERALLFGLPAGIIILRILYFRDSKMPMKFFDILLASLLLSLMPLLHTHTTIAMAIILPILTLPILKKGVASKELRSYLLVAILAFIFAVPQTSTLLEHLNQSDKFMRIHLGWMKGPNETLLWFWFKNTYLLIPFSLIVLLISKFANFQIKILQICAFILLAIMNIILFSPYDWDNVKLLFWIGLFFDIAAASVLGYLFQRKELFSKLTALIITITMISSALLSILREINVSYLLFSKEAVEVGKQLKTSTPQDSIFLTYKIHNSPVNNLAGRTIMMGYPGLLWTQGINYLQRENDINKIFLGSKEAPYLINKYHINYVVLENYQPEGMTINRDFFSQYPILLKTTNYTIYQVQ